MARGKRGFGSIRKVSSGRFQARYTGPDSKTHNAPTTFARKSDADAWLAGIQTQIAMGEWKSPEEVERQERAYEAEARRASILFSEWAEEWLASLPSLGRSPKTIQTHRYRMRRLLDEFGSRPLAQLTPADVSIWYARTWDESGPGVARPVYMTLSTMMNAAKRAQLIDENPCQVPGGQDHKTSADTQRQVATPEEIHAAASAMPDELALAIHLAAWCQLREGEIIGLQRRDLRLEGNAPTLTVARQVQYLIGEGPQILPPKSEAGSRIISIPASLIPAIAAHLDAHTGPDADNFVFHRTADQQAPIHPNSLRGAWNRAREAAGIPWFKFHDLRHTGLTIFAQQGATLAELLYRGGHSDVSVALRYQHASRERDRALAARMDAEIRGD